MPRTKTTVTLLIVAALNATVFLGGAWKWGG